jgi:hypothetical protein
MAWLRCKQTTKPAVPDSGRRIGQRESETRGGRESVGVQDTGCCMPDTMLVVVWVDTPY